MSKRLLTACAALALSAACLPAYGAGGDEPWIAARRDGAVDAEGNIFHLAGKRMLEY